MPEEVFLTVCNGYVLFVREVWIETSVSQVNVESEHLRSTYVNVKANVHFCTSDVSWGCVWVIHHMLMGTEVRVIDRIYGLTSSDCFSFWNCVNEILLNLKARISVWLRLRLTPEHDDLNPWLLQFYPLSLMTLIIVLRLSTYSRDIKSSYSRG